MDSVSIRYNVPARKTEHVCAFCTLVIQIGYDELTDDDIAKVAVHMRIAHGLKRYEIPPETRCSRSRSSPWHPLTRRLIDDDIDVDNCVCLGTPDRFVFQRAEIRLRDTRA